MPMFLRLDFGSIIIGNEIWNGEDSGLNGGKPQIKKLLKI